MYGIATASAYFFTICACFWSCVRLADNLAMVIGPEIVASISSTDRSPSRVERRLQNLAEPAEPVPVRPPVRAMTPPNLSAAQLARAMDRTEAAARLVRSLPLSSLPLETVPAIAVAASGPNEEVTVITLEAKPRKAAGKTSRYSNTRDLMLERPSKRKVSAGATVVLRNTDDSPRAKKRALAAAIASERVPIDELAPQLNATPGALMFASFIRRES